MINGNENKAENDHRDQTKYRSHRSKTNRSRPRHEH